MARCPVLEMSVDTAHGELGEMLTVKNKTIPASKFASLILDGRHLQRHKSVLLTYLLNIESLRASIASLYITAVTQSWQKINIRTWRPALAERDTALALALPLSFPAFPPA